MMLRFSAFPCLTGVFSSSIKGISAFALLSLLFVQPAHTAGQDHPLLSAMKGFEVYRSDVSDFDTLVVPLDRVNQVDGKKYEGPTRFEGKITKLDYRGASEASALAIYRNFLEAIQSLGGRALSVRPEKAGNSDLDWNVFEVPRRGSTPLHVLQKSGSKGFYSLVIVEPAALVQTVKAGALADQLKVDGFAAMYIEFDTNKTELKADGQAAVREVVTLLNQDKTLKLSIEGHTDNVGDAAANRKLSMARAQAVVAAVQAQGIDAARLRAQGRGPDMPVADNRREDGRAKNRRVELVKLP
jgi:OmpA-OmpF porin, OOP family